MLRVSRVWAMANKWTFTIPPIMELIKRYMADSAPWVDPFAGMTSPAHIRNDLNPDAPAEYHMDALEFLRSLDDETAAGLLFDPPYTLEMGRRHYKMYHEMCTAKFASYLSKCKDEAARIVTPGGAVLSFGWDSCGVGKSRHCDLEEVLLVNHGGGNCHNDTIVTIERKMQISLLNFIEATPAATSTALQISGKIYDASQELEEVEDTG